MRVSRSQGYIQVQGQGIFSPCKSNRNENQHFRVLRSIQHYLPTMLYIIGLGLCVSHSLIWYCKSLTRILRRNDEKDITVKGLEAIKASKRVYLEAYTSILNIKQEQLVGLLQSRVFLYSSLSTLSSYLSSLYC